MGSGAWQQAQRAARRKAGLCIQCGKPTPTWQPRSAAQPRAKAYCAAHAQQIKDWRIAREARAEEAACRTA